MAYPSLEKPGPSFSFIDYRNAKTFEQMSDDPFATFVAFSSERSRGNVESALGGYRDRFYFKGGKQIKELMSRYGVKEENVENVLRGFGEADWIEIGKTSRNSGLAVLTFDDLIKDDWYDLNAQHDNELYIQVRLYVLDKFEELCPNNKRPSCSGND